MLNSIRLDMCLWLMKDATKTIEKNDGLVPVVKVKDAWKCAYYTTRSRAEVKLSYLLAPKRFRDKNQDLYDKVL